MTWDRLSPRLAMASAAATSSRSSLTDVFSFTSRSYASRPDAAAPCVCSGLPPDAR